MILRRVVGMMMGCLGISCLRIKDQSTIPASLSECDSSSASSEDVDSKKSTSSSSSSSSLDLSGRIKLRDGRYLAFKERGVSKNQSKYKIIIVHGFASNKEMNFMASQVNTSKTLVLFYLILYKFMCFISFLEEKNYTHLDFKSILYKYMCFIAFLEETNYTHLGFKLDISIFVDVGNNCEFQKLMDELGIYILQFDRAGYGESDPNPRRSLKSEASDIQEIADQLKLGSKFYLIGVSVGAYPTWSCVKNIPERYKKRNHFFCILTSC